MATLSQAWTVAVDVEPDVAIVRPRETATFDCDVINNDEPIHEYTWTLTPPISDSRLTYDNNHKTIHISNLNASENNTVVTCNVIPDEGGPISMSGIIEMLEDNDGDGGGDGDWDEDNPRPRPRTTTKRPTPRLQPTTVLATQRKTTARPNIPKVSTLVPTDKLTANMINPGAGEMGQGNARAFDKFNPATIGALLGISVLIVLAIIFIIVQRRKNRQRPKPQRTADRSAMHPQPTPQDGYEVTSLPPIAHTIDSRYSQDHGRLYNPKYQKPIHKDHKSLPSVAYSHDSGCVEEYVYMEPGELRGHSFGGSLGVPLGDGYDHLARSNPDLLNLANPSSPTSPPGMPINYAKLTPTTSPTLSSDYENHCVEGMHTFELDEQKRLKYASLSHQGKHDNTVGQHPPKRKTSYAKIRGVLRILRTQNSTRVNIEPH